jgi:uncharacterized membrane protein
MEEVMKVTNKKRILWITNTALFTALLIVLQAATAPFGNILITGTIVNLLLIVSVMTCGAASGLTVALISPIMAKFFGIGPLWVLIPFIAAGNIMLVLVWHMLGNKDLGTRYRTHLVTTVVAAAAKFAVLYVGIVRIAVPLFLGLPAQQAAMVSKMFSFPQLFTATMGGIIAAMILPSLKKAIRHD